MYGAKVVDMGFVMGDLLGLHELRVDLDEELNILGKWKERQTKASWKVSLALATRLQKGINWEVGVNLGMGWV